MFEDHKPSPREDVCYSETSSLDHSRF
jgi:hypothetical protein